MDESNRFKLSKGSKIWLISMLIIIVIGLICTYCADKRYEKDHPIVPQVPTEIVDSVHNANK